jgi:hypothetical protein
MIQLLQVQDQQRNRVLLLNAWVKVIKTRRY